jgi:Tol biopolymer transport system component
VISSLGSGGMGDVYTARDTRLGRTVAIKVLSAALSASPDARERLKREARTLSQLSHPHICALYDVGEQGDIDFLVMEVLAGETLASRLAKGPLPFGQAVQLATGIASALDAAHRRGIVHRDLKPGNVMLTPTGAKLLDFGLAKPLAPLAQGSGADATVSFRREMTAEGTILGTIQYMSPEQIEGRPADARSDLFAFGATLFEMATGRRAFTGASPAAIASAIMATDPPAVSSLQPAAPAAFDRLVKGCLAKDPDERWQSAHDAVLLLQSIAEPDRHRAPAPSRWSHAAVRWAPWVMAAAAVALFIARGAWQRPPDPAPQRPITFTIAPPSGRFFTFFENVEMAVSPDGTTVAMAASDTAGLRLLWLRPLAAADATPLPGTEGAVSAFWSPDGKSLGFFADDKLKRIDLPGTTPVVLCPTLSSIGYSGSWGADGRILFASLSAGSSIMAVSSAGGTPVEEQTADSSRPELRLRFPHFLPDGRQYLYLARDENVRGRLMLAVRGQTPREVMQVNSNVQYVDPGYLMFVRDGTLLAQRFDVTTGNVSGDPMAIADPVNYFSSTANAHFSASRGGVVAFQSHSDVAHLAWFDRAGTETVIATMPPGGYLDLRMSADGREVLLPRAQPGNGTFDLWRLDLRRGVDERMTSDPGNEISALWVPGRRAIVYARGTPPHMVVRDESTGAESPVTPGTDFQGAQDITPDGQWLAYTQRKNTGTFGLFVLRLAAAADRTPSDAYDSPFEHDTARFSPDGHSLAFSAADSGHAEIYVAPFPANGRKERVSTNGGTSPRWTRNGRELFYLSKGALMAAPMTAGRPAGAPVVVFKTPGAGLADYDVSADGRFIAIVPETFANQQPMTVIVNWPAKLR